MSEKKSSDIDPEITGVDHGVGVVEKVHDSDEDAEVFKKVTEGVDFRTVGWPRASFIFLKVIFSTGILSIPVAMVSLGAVGGALSILGWGALNTYTAIIQGDFRNRHPSCHSLADMAMIVGGNVLREFVGGLYIIAWVLCTGSAIVAVSVALNSFSDHAACTVWWSFLASAVVIFCASARTFHTIGWLTWAGFVSVFLAVFVLVVAVTTHDRPTGAPQTGPFELGYAAITHPTFIAGITASSTIFVSSAGSSSFIPVIAEMRNPKDYRKALYSCMALINVCYLAFSLVVYKWCGQWVTSPSLGSAGPKIEKVTYGIGLIGLLVSATLCLHIASKYLFVRILRNTKHLQSNTMIHWGTWLSCTIGLGACSFVLAEAIPIFNFLIALVGSFCFAPLVVMLPGFLWLHDFNIWKTGTAQQRVIYWTHWFLPVLGAFMCVGGTYGVVVQINDAFKDHTIGSAFSCANNA